MLRRRKVFPKSIFICFFNNGSLFFGKTTVRENGSNIGHGKWCWFFFFFVLCRNLDKTTQISLNVKEHCITFLIILANHIFYNILESKLLFGCSEFCTTAKTSFHKFGMRGFGIPCVKHDGMDVCASVCKCRKYETGIRCTDNPVADAWSDAVFIFTITKPWLCEVHRTDCTKQIFVNFFGFI